MFPQVSKIIFIMPIIYNNTKEYYLMLMHVLEMSIIYLTFKGDGVMDVDIKDIDISEDLDIST